VTTATSGLKAAAEGSLRTAPPLHDVARAKVNLTLEVRGRRADGYHELESLVAFTRFGDSLTLEPGRPFSLEVTGPFASAIECGNLIEKAAALHAAEEVGAGCSVAGARPHHGAFRLEKHIPVAAGLGGGSADAAAALRLLSEHHGDPDALSAHLAISGGLGSDPAATALRLPAGVEGASDGLSAQLAMAAKLGADVPVCLFSRPAIMTGIGERVSLLAEFPPIPIVLVNPRQPLATAAVFRDVAAAPLTAPPASMALPALATIDDVVAYARCRPNDLQAPAERLLPVIGRMLAHLAACPGALLARLSGSGPTCFALFRTQHEAQAAAAALSADCPLWWVQETTLG
jgi:4-diphosphocytidyl-2-C-methyl-D-erythritol kinase